MIPIGDDNDDGHYNHAFDFINYFFIFFCVGVFVYEASLDADQIGPFVDKWSLRPSEYFSTNFLQANFFERLLGTLRTMADVTNMALVKILASTFIHGSPLHLLGNMLFLWIVGDNVEYVMGHLRYFIFFIICAIFSEVFNEVLLTGQAFEQPSIGASGAIFGVIGAYVRYFPRAKIIMLYRFFLVAGTFPLPAWLVFGAYFAGNVMSAVVAYGSDYGMVAVWAHVFGFICGFALSFVFKYDRDHVNVAQNRMDNSRRKFQRVQRKLKAKDETPPVDNNGDDSFTLG